MYFRHNFIVIFFGFLLPNPTTYVSMINKLLAHFENGCDVTMYFVLDRTERARCCQVAGKCVQLQEGAVEMLAHLQRCIIMSHSFSMLVNTYFAKQLTSMSIIIESIIAASCKIKVV